MNTYIHKPSGAIVTTASNVSGDGWELVKAGDEAKADKPRPRRRANKPEDEA